jgi:hypothetical protein
MANPPIFRRIELATVTSAEIITVSWVTFYVLSTIYSRGGFSKSSVGEERTERLQVGFLFTEVSYGDVRVIVRGGSTFPTIGPGRPLSGPGWRTMGLSAIWIPTALTGARK